MNTPLASLRSTNGWKVERAKYHFREIDDRAGGRDLQLLAVSAYRGVVPRSDTATGARSGDLSLYKVVEPGDLVINRMSAYEGALGRATSTGIVSPEYMVLRPRDSLESRYFSYLAKSSWFVAEMTARLRGIGTPDQGNVRTPRVNVESVGTIPIPIPPIPEQQAIADFLEKETSRVDALIARKLDLGRLLKARWRAAVAARMDELRQVHGTIPLKRLVQCLDGRRIPLSAEERKKRQGPIPYYGASGVIDYVDDWLFDEEIVLLGEDGAQLGDPSYDISLVVRERCWVNNHAHVLRPIAGDADFLSLHLNTFDRFAFISGATREKITQDDMKSIPFPNVDLSVQREEAARLLSIRAKAEGIQQRLASQAKLLQEHRQSLITARTIGEVPTPVAA